MLDVLDVIRRRPETSLYEAARMCRVNEHTVYGWRRRNTRDFATRLEAALSGGVIDCEELPDIETVVESPDWLNMGDQVWPGVMAELQEINSGQYDQILLTGGISSGKTFAAVLSLAYQLLRLLVMKDAHAELGLSDRSPILLAVQNRTQKQAARNDFALLRNIVESAPVFQTRFPHEARLKSRIKFVGKAIECWPVGGSPEEVLGMNLHSLLIDEANFFAYVERSQKSVDGNPFDQAFEAYETAMARKQTRFPCGAGQFFVASSKRYQGQFTDKLERAHANDPKTYVYNHTAWSIRPEAFPKETFQVFVGDQARPPRVLDRGDVVDAADRDLIIEVPKTDNLLRRFKSGNIYRALQDIAGISTTQIAGFFRDRVKINDAASLPNLFKVQDADLTRLAVTDIIHSEYASKQEGTFYWAHCDLSLSGDKTGIAIGKIDDFELAGDLWVPTIRIPFLLRVHPPRYGQIELDAVRRLLFALANAGLPIKWVSFDGFQSADIMQRVAKRFIVHKISVDQTSVDDPIAAMETLRTAVEESRIKFAYHETAVGELLSLKLDSKRNRVDHPPNGSKDLADAIAGVTYGLSHYVKPTDIGRYDVWAHNVQPGDMKYNPAHVSGGPVFDTAYSRDDEKFARLSEWLETH